MKKEKIKDLVENEIQRFKMDLVSKIEMLALDNKAAMGQHLDVSEVSQLMNLSKKTIRRYASENKLPSDKDVSGRLKFKREDVEKFIKNIQSKKYGI